MVWRRDRHCIDRFVFQQFPEIRKARRTFAGRFLNLAKASVQYCLVDITDRRDFHILHVQIVLDVLTALAVDANTRDTYAIVRTGKLGPQGGGCRSHHEMSTLQDVLPFLSSETVEE